MLETDRQDVVMRVLAEHGRCRMADLLRLLPVSEATVRRDINKLCNKGLLRRIRGGIESLGAGHKSGLGAPVSPVQPSKDLLGKLAVSLVNSEDAIILDGGQSLLHMARYLSTADLFDLTIFTNSFPVAQQLLSATAHRVIISGGVVNRDHYMMIDPAQEEPYGAFVWRTLFMGVAGIDEDGFTNSDDRLIRCQHQLIKRSERVVVVAESGKYKRRGRYRLCDWQSVDYLVTDAEPGEDLLTLCEKNDVTVCHPGNILH